jgi:hypothetical protein
MERRENVLQDFNKDLKKKLQLPSYSKVLC